MVHRAVLDEAGVEGVFVAFDHPDGQIGVSARRAVRPGCGLALLPGDRRRQVASVGRSATADRLGEFIGILFQGIRDMPAHGGGQGAELGVSALAITAPKTGPAQPVAPPMTARMSMKPRSLAGLTEVMLIS